MKAILISIQLECKYYDDGFSDCDEYCGLYENGVCKRGLIPLKRPPQSWQYVEE